MAAHFGLKVPKAEKPQTTPYTIFNPHHQEPRWTTGMVRVISIDPGRDHLGIRVDIRNTDLSYCRVELFELIDLGKDFLGIFLNLTDYLESRKSLFQTANYCVIERQMPQNYIMMRVAQTIITYMYLILKDLSHLPLILEVDTKLKGKVLGFDLEPKDIKIKSWGTKKAKEFLERYQDLESIRIMNSAKRMQDLADTVIQVDALFYTIFIKPSQK